MAPALLDFAAIGAADAPAQPFPYLVAHDLLRPADAEALTEDFPDVEASGLLPDSTLRLSPLLSRLAAELRGPEMAASLGKKFGVDLAGLPTMLTVRSRCAAKDGRIHTDSENKVVTLLFYLNPNWRQEGGRLRLLRSGDDLEDYIAEVSPEAGTLVAFRRSENSWHGHHPFVGTRRYLMVNWMRGERVAGYEQMRHKIAAGLKGVFA
jgi:hypothetical protein